MNSIEKNDKLIAEQKDNLSKLQEHPQVWFFNSLKSAEIGDYNQLAQSKLKGMLKQKCMVMTINNKVQSDIDRKQVQTFKELTQLINCNDDELQDLLILGMQGGVVTAKINEIKKFVAFREVIPMGQAKPEVVQARLVNLKANIAKIRNEIHQEKEDTLKEGRMEKLIDSLGNN